MHKGVAENMLRDEKKQSFILESQKEVSVLDKVKRIMFLVPGHFLLTTVSIL